MANCKFIFNNDGTTETIENYILEEEEINELKAYDAARKKEEKEERDNVDESEMSIEEIKAWTVAKARGKSYEEFRDHWEDKSSSPKPKVKTSPKNGTSKNNSSKSMGPKGKKSSRQKPRTNIRGMDSVSRTYLMEIDNIKKLEKLRLMRLDEEFVQYSEIVNDAIEYYFEKVCGNNS